MDRNEVGRCFHAAALKSGHVLGDLREGRIGLDQRGEILFHHLEHLVHVFFRHFKPDVEAALRKSLGIIIPLASQSPDGSVEVNLGAKGVIEVELVSSGEKWGRGPRVDIHSSLEAAVDSPVWHLVQALNTLVKEDGHTPAIEGFFDKVKPLTPRQKAILDASIPKKNEAGMKRALGIERWFGDESFHDSQLRLVSQPTVNIEGLVSGWTGPGGKTILPGRAVAKLDLRLVPDMTATAISVPASHAA